jgi:hypothetical protein
MTDRPTIDQYTRMAERLLGEAIDAPLQKKQELIRDAAVCVAVAMGQVDGVHNAPVHFENGLSVAGYWITY